MINVTHLQTGDNGNNAQLLYLSMMERKGAPINGFQANNPASIGRDILGGKSEKERRARDAFLKIMAQIQTAYDAYMQDIAFYRTAIAARQEEIGALSEFLSSALEIMMLSPKSKRPAGWRDQKRSLVAQIAALASERDTLNDFDRDLDRSARNASRGDYTHESDWEHERTRMRDRARSASADLFDDEDDYGYDNGPALN